MEACPQLQQSNAETQKEEILSLRSIFCGEDECTMVHPQTFDELERSDKPGEDGPVSLTIKLVIPVSGVTNIEDQVTEIVVNFTLPGSYPGEPPLIKLSSCDYSPELTTALQQKATTYAKTLTPGVCMYSIVRWLIDSLVADHAPSILSSGPVASSLGFPVLSGYANTAGKPGDEASGKDNGAVKDTVMESVLHLSSSERKPPLEMDIASGLRGSSIREPSAEPSSITAIGSNPKSAMSTCIRQQGLTANYISIVKIDHMRNEHRYHKMLRLWSQELNVSGRIMNCGQHFIYVVLVGLGGSLSEFLKRWRTQNVDVSSQGRPCKERLISVLCQQPLGSVLPLWYRRDCLSGSMELFHCSKTEAALAVHFSGIELFFAQFVQPTLER